jgi:hypothetical protein
LTEYAIEQRVAASDDLVLLDEPAHGGVLDDASIAQTPVTAIRLKAEMEAQVFTFHALDQALDVFALRIDLAALSAERSCSGDWHM